MTVSPANKLLMENIVSDLKDTKNGIDDLHTKVHNGDLKIVTLAGKVDNLAEKFETMSLDVKNLIKVIKDGNGQPSIMTRLNKLESSQEITNDFVVGHKNYINETNKGKTALKVALITGSLGLIASIITVVTNVFYG